jgi:erythromycin esterase
LQKGFTAQTFRNKMYWPQAGSKELDKLLDYIEAQSKGKNPIQMEGFDSRLQSIKSFYRYTDSLITNSEISFSKSGGFNNYLSTLKKVLRNEYQDTIINENAKLFISQTDSIILQLTAKAKNKRGIQLMRNLNGYVKNAWNINHSRNPVERFHEREKQMAENLIWLAEIAYPNEKIIIRMHNRHASKNINKLEKVLPDSIVKNALTVGTLISKKYRKNCLHIGTTDYEGTYVNSNFETLDVPKSNSLEEQLHNKKLNYAYVDFTAKRNTSFYMFFNDFNNWLNPPEIKAKFGQLFDGIIFINKVNAPTKKNDET